jgi:hypothetical protein
MSTMLTVPIDTPRMFSVRMFYLEKKGIIIRGKKREWRGNRRHARESL